MDYLAEAIQRLQAIRAEEGAAIEAAAQAIAGALEAGHLVYVFGATHASLLAQELFYRAGGLVPINPILPPALSTAVRPITQTTASEREPGLGTQLVAESPIAAGDVVIVHSVSGRNAAPVEFAQAARARGAYVIALTSLEYSRAVAPRQPGQPRLFEAADLVLDNHAPVGDALVAVSGLAQRVGPVSTVTGAAILNAVVVRVAELLQAATGDAPVFVSANLDGGDARNQRWLDHYAGRLTYL